MNFFASLFRRVPKESKPNKLGYLLRSVREHAIIVSTCALVFLLVGVLLFDSFVFYTTVVQERKPVSGNEKKIDLSEKEVTDTLMLLDERQKNFDEILGQFGGAKIATSSASVRPAQEKKNRP